VVGFALASVVVVVRDRVLDPSLYSEALVRADAYERVYTEVLADPELAELKEQLLGGLQLDRLDATQLRVLTTSALRATVPPSTLRQGTETFIASLLAYLRGETARLDADVDVTELLGRIRETAVVAVSTLLAPVADRVVGSVDAYRDAVAAFAAQLGSGTVPSAIPVLGGRTADPLQVLDVVVDELDVGVDPRLREQILATVLAGDERGALIDAASRVITEHAAEASEALRASIEDRRRYDVITGLAERAGRSRATIVGPLNSARDAARWFNPVTALLGLVLMLGAAAGIVWFERANPRRAGFTVAAAAAASGLTLLVLWMVATGLLEAPLAPATGSGPGSWNLPAGLRSLLADIQTTLGDELALTVRRLALVPIAAGAVLAGVLVAVPRLRLPSPVRALPVGAAAAVIAGVAVAIVSRDAAALERCNGYAELCDRPYDEVVYAATHNSMSSPDVVVVWPEHDGDIRAQLDYGVRALHRHPLLDPTRVRRAVGDGRPVPSAGSRRAGLRQPRAAPRRARRHLPLPQRLRTRRDTAGRLAPHDPGVPRREPRRGRHADHPGRHHAGRHGRRRHLCRARALPAHPPSWNPLGHPRRARRPERAPRRVRRGGGFAYGVVPRSVRVHAGDALPVRGARRLLVRHQPWRPRCHPVPHEPLGATDRP
jgi:hypothetical protein